ncbi:MAG TPA: DinB family protein [Terracidiphilus sp.]|nr:DinB family protein [Terracidiphilus sp.]
MFTVNGIRKLHNWTHAAIAVVLDHLSTVPPDAYETELPSFGFSTLHRQVIHIFNCEGFWIHTLQGLSYIDRIPADFPRVADTVPFQQTIIGRTDEYLSTLTDQQLNSDTELHFPDGDTAVRTPALILHHVFTHAFHHKGQIVAMCRHLGHPAPDTDLNQFV